MKYEELLVVLMANPMECRKCVETMFGAGKREVFEIPRGDTLLQNHSSKDHEHLAKIPPPFSLDHRPDTRTSTKSKDTAEENEQSSRENLECKLQEPNQNLQKLHKYQNLINLYDNTKKIETSLKKIAASVKLLDYTIERRKYVETVHRVRK
mmetsp:Transcript_8608/g.17655  ORF Transcript_8608/g.17655 Transcript_8608/m.17655 type:complete len:152 (+) Transcript_8608:109-564(+)